MQEIEYGLRGEVGVSDVERLEKIKDRYMEREYDYALSSMDIDWLISTVEEQQKEIERLNKAIEKEMHTGFSLEGQIHDVKEKLEKENAQLREALRDIKDIMSHHSPVHNIAKSALEGKE